MMAFVYISVEKIQGEDGKGRGEEIIISPGRVKYTPHPLSAGEEGRQCEPSHLSKFGSISVEQLTDTISIDQSALV